MSYDQNKLLQLLQSRGLVSAETAASVVAKAAETGQAIEEILRVHDFVSEHALTTAKAALLNVPPPLRRRRQPVSLLSAIIPYEVAVAAEVVPLRQAPGILEVGMVDPSNFQAFEILTNLIEPRQLRLQHRTISRNLFEQLLAEYPQHRSVEQTLRGQTLPPIVSPVELSATDIPSDRLALVILSHAVEGRASDIHLEPTAYGSQVRFRLDGILKPSLVLSSERHESVVEAYKRLAKLDIVSSNLPQQGRFRLVIVGHMVDFRLSTTPLGTGEKVTIKVLDRHRHIFSLADAGFSPEQIELLDRRVKAGRGLILIVGPRLAGKTITTYALLRRINAKKFNLVTLEDPIEYSLPGVNQSQVEPAIGYTFEVGLEAILQQEPDVIAVDDVPTPHSAALTVAAALARRLVIASVYAHDSSQALIQLLSLGVPPRQLADALRVVVCQRLVRRLCPSCGVTTTDGAGNRVGQAVGCSYCGGSGYKGRLVVAEVVENFSELATAIEQNNHSAIRLAIERQAQPNLAADAVAKVASGLTSMEEINKIVPRAPLL